MCLCTPGKGRIPKQGKKPGKAEPKFCYEGECTNIRPRMVRLKPFWTLQFELPGLPKTTNSHRSAGQWARLKHDKEWKEAMRIIAAKPPNGPLKTFALHLTRYSSNEPDYDGLVSSFKSVVDGLKEAGVIEDDKLSNTGVWVCRWIKVQPGEGKIQVIVTSVEPTEGNPFVWAPLDAVRDAVPLTLGMTTRVPPPPTKPRARRRRRRSSMRSRETLEVLTRGHTQTRSTNSTHSSQAGPPTPSGCGGWWRR